MERIASDSVTRGLVNKHLNIINVNTETSTTLVTYDINPCERLSKAAAIARAKIVSCS